MKGLFGQLYSMHGHTIDDYLRKERAKKLNLWKQYWPTKLLSGLSPLILLSHQINLHRLATYSAYLAANDDTTKEALHNFGDR